MIYLIILAALLFVVNLFLGSVALPAADVFSVLIGQSSAEEVALIVLHSRLPEAVVALLAGGGLAVSGLVMQTLFSNSLADPSLLGVNAGASLGVAVAVMLLGGSSAAVGVALSGRGLMLAAAFVGAMVVIGLLVLCARVMPGRLQLLVAGVMLSFVVSAVIGVLSFFASASGVQTFVVWGLGTFSGIPLASVSWLAVGVLVGVVAICLMAKSLNALLLGEDYAQNLGISARWVSLWCLVWVGLLSATVTAFCGPIGFVGLAVPHAVRMLFRTARHQRLAPACFWGGACVALCCNVLARIVSDYSVLPINTITPLFGVPVVLALLMRQRGR